MMRMKALHQRGDTIVEVLIAIAITSGLLVITYGTMNRNTLLTRANQERAEATRTAQGQIEALNRLATDNPTSIPTGANVSFCIDGTGPQPLAGVPATNIVNDDLSPTGPYAAHCQKGFYNYAIVRQSTNTYRIYVRWDRIGGGARNEIIMAYRTVSP